MPQSASYVTMLTEGDVKHVLLHWSRVCCFHLAGDVLDTTATITMTRHFYLCVPSDRP